MPSYVTEIIIPAVLFLVGLVEALLMFIVRDAFKRIDQVVLQAGLHETKIAVLSGSKTSERVDDHEVRLRMLEAGLAEIKADIRVIRQLLERNGT